MRFWDLVAGNKIEVEPKKDMKERTGRSPDLGDWAALCVEGARRKGFNIAKLVNEEERERTTEWLDTLYRRQQSISRHELTFS